MRQLILLIMIMLPSCTLFSQGWQVGDVLTGKHVKYKVFDQCECFFYVKNVKNRDTVRRQENIYIPESMYKRIHEIVYNHLSPEELSLVIKEKYDLNFRFIVNRKFRIQEIIFLFDKEEPFWLNFSVDRLYKIEREIIKNIDIDERDRKWITDREIEKQFFSGSIQFQVLRRMKKNKEKEAMENSAAESEKNK